MTKTLMTRPWVIEKGKWGYFVALYGQEIEGFDTKAEAKQFIVDYEKGAYRWSEYDRRVSQAENR